jgi:hypothetical protein
MKRKALPLLFAVVLAASTQASIFKTNLIDPFTTFQIISTNNATVTNTVAATSIGGFRTLILSTPGASLIPTVLGVDDTVQEFVLNSPTGITPSFEVLWGGAGGTNGLGGVAFGDGLNLDLGASFLSFGLGFADQPSSYTWKFTDTANNSATYTGTFPQLQPPNPPLTNNISLNSFSNAAGIDWNAIDFISFSGGNVASVDINGIAPFEVIASVPEPGTWALLATGLGLTALALRRKANPRH